MTSFHASSKEVIILKEDCDKNDSGVVDHRETIAVVSILNLEKVSSSYSSSSSCINDGSMSTATTRISNTTKRRSETKKKKRTFLLFVKILMKIIEEKDKEIFQNAKTVISYCEQQKKRGEIESFIESLRAPLKDVVGPHYWREARERLSNKLQLHRNNKTAMSSAAHSEEGSTTESALHSTTTRLSSIHCRVDGSSLPTNMLKSKTSTKQTVTATATNNNNNNNKEMRTRKKRLWMIISILMQYLQRNHAQLHLKAHALVDECVQRHRDRQKYCERYSSLSGSIQSCLKNEIGVEYWRQAEKWVAKFLLAHDEKTNNTGERIGRNIIINKRAVVIDNVYNMDTKRPCFANS